MIRVAIIGAGKMGLLHASLLKVIPDVELVAICEKSWIISRFSRNALPDTNIVTKIDKLSGMDLDVVYVTTPTPTHYAIIKAVLDKKISRHIFVEKPLANSNTESRELCDLINQSVIGGINVVGYNRRYGVTFRKAREIISEGVIGESVYFEGYAFSSDFHPGSDGSKKVSRGGVLRDLGCHAIDLAIWYLGDLNVKSLKINQASGGRVIDSASFEVDTENGSHGQIKASWCEATYRLPEIGFVLETSNGRRLAVNDDKLEQRDLNGKVNVWYKQDLVDSTYFMLGGTDYYREDEEYINAIKTRKGIEPSFYTASKVDEIIEHVESLFAEWGNDR
ncbi:Gfo/Idh/MocA family protein [Chloroflexota bacterium]